MNGKFEEQFANGSLKEEITYKNGKKEGEFVKYYDFGEWKLKYKPEDSVTGMQADSVYYFDGQKIKAKGQYKNNLLEGKVTYYKLNGKIDKTEVYKSGELIKNE